jgi:ubiquitin-protein ligase
MLRKKRGADELLSEENEQVLSDQIKKVRISQTPGDIRLQKDLLDFIGINGVSIQETAEKSCIIITFTNMPFQSPNTYHIRIPKLYPHVPPVVTCLVPGFSSPYFDYNGKIIHPALTDEWTAINSLYDVAQILQDVISSVC